MTEWGEVHRAERVALTQYADRYVRGWGIDPQDVVADAFEAAMTSTEVPREPRAWLRRLVRCRANLLRRRVASERRSLRLVAPLTVDAPTVVRSSRVILHGEAYRAHLNAQDRARRAAKRAA